MTEGTHRSALMSLGPFFIWVHDLFSKWHWMVHKPLNSKVMKAAQLRYLPCKIECCTTLKVASVKILLHGGHI